MEESKYFSNQRRLRANRHIRELSATVTLSHVDFIQPLFLDEHVKERIPIASLTGVNSDSIESILDQIESDKKAGVSKFLLFPVPATKAESTFDFSFVRQAIKKIKSNFGEDIWLALDLCLCAYTSHGHCGILNKDQTRLLNDETVNILSQYALDLAEAGADCISPSDMMDGRVAAIRHTLDRNGFDYVAIMSYSAKTSSNFYGPFRDACHSSPQEGLHLTDRKTYQISPFNGNDGVRSALRDAREGADIVMVKPALLNADVLCELKRILQMPLAAYHVSGEYQGLELMAAQGILERDKSHAEVWTVLKRAGADIIISYAAREARKWIEKIDY